MLKSLSARAIVPVALTVTGFVLVCCILLYAGIKEDMTRDTVQHSLTLADTVIKSTRHAMLRADRETVGNIVDNVGRQEGVRHLRIFDKKGLIRFSPAPEEIDHYVDKGAGGCLQCHADPTPKSTLADMQKARLLSVDGTDVLAITAPIYNDPACFSAACHVHTAEQKTLGILDIGLDLAPLEQTLAVLKGRMAVFTVLVLFLTVGGVTALLRRTVLVPIQDLAGFTEKALHDKVTEKMPGGGEEIGAIAANFHDLRQRLNQALDELEARRDATPEPAAAYPADTDHESRYFAAPGGDREDSSPP